ncbi:MAG: penicillin-binding protein 1A [Treponema sp.]
MHIGKICFFLYLMGVFILLAAGSSVFGYVLAQTYMIKQSEHFTAFNPDLPTRILDIRGDLITEFSSNEKREIITFDKISPTLIHALLVREDRSFYHHRGFTLKAIFRAVIGKLTRKSLGGGSTITQQIAGMLYCDRADISVKRKIKELWWAMQMERRYSKNEIMELYLNKVYFGGGTYGVSAASRFYFGHPVADITAAEAAILVIQLSNPAHYNPFENPNIAQDRQDYVLTEMVRLGYLTQEEKDDSFDEYWAHFDYTRTKSSAWFNREDKARWFSEYVRRQLESMMYGTMDFYSDGYVVHTTCDLRHQAAAEKEIGEYITLANKRVSNSRSYRFSQNELYSNMSALISLTFNLPALHIDAARARSKCLSYYCNTVNPVIDMTAMLCGLNTLKIASTKNTLKVQDELAKKTVEGTLICIENNTGYITALVGGSKFDESNQVIRAIQGRIQPGSSFKPLLYSAAIDSKLITPATVLEDTPQVFKNQSGVPYIPNNYAGHWQGTTLAWKALAQSLNIPAIKILDTIGFDAAINRAALLLDITDRDEIDRTFPRVYPLALGIISVAPVQMAKAFACFANEGRKVEPIAIRTIENRSGTIIMDPERDIRIEQRRKGTAMQLISPQNAFIMTSMMRKTLTAGTLVYATSSGKKFRYKDEKTGKSFTMPIAGKTGTTQNWSDAWAIGYSPYYTTAVWFGFDKGGQSLGLDNSGATLAGPPWANFMQTIHADKPYKDFIRPETGITSVEVCKKSGLRPTDHCTEGTVFLHFLSGTAPAAHCTYHESDSLLLEIAKDRFRKSSYGTGQAPVDVGGGGVFLDPRIFEDPEPSKNSRSNAHTNSSMDETDFDSIMDEFNSDSLLEDTPPASSELVDSSETPPAAVLPDEAVSPAGTVWNVPPDTHDKASSESNSLTPDILQPDRRQPELVDPSLPEQQPAEKEKTNNSTIQDEGVNPWL